MNDSKKTNLIAERSKEIRTRLNIQSKDWALLFGKHEATVTNNESGRTKLDAADFLTIQSLFGNQCILYLFGIADHPFESLETWAQMQKKANEIIKELKEKANKKGVL